MYSRFIQRFPSLGVLGVLLLVLALALGCEENRRSRYRTDQMRRLGSQAIGATEVIGPSARTVYAVSIVSGSQPVMQNTNGRNGYQTRNMNYDPSRAMSAPSVSGKVSVIGVEDGTDEPLETPPNAVRYFRISNPGYTNGISGTATHHMVNIPNISLDTYCEVTPDGSSLLVTSPDSNTMNQIFLSEDGAMLDSVPIQLQGKPTRFAFNHGYGGENRYVLVATSSGIEVLKVDINRGQNYGPQARVLGTPQRVSPGYGPDFRSTAVDVAISFNDEVVYASSNGMVMYKPWEILMRQTDPAAWQMTRYTAKKLITMPVVVQEKNQLDGEIVGALNDNGFDFINVAGTALSKRFWQSIGRYQPRDVAFHKDGTSVLVLTDSQIWRFTLLPEGIGTDIKYMELGGNGARKMAIDKRKGNFVAVGINTVDPTGRSGYKVVFPRLDDYGIISPSSVYDAAPVDGQVVCVATR